MTRKVNTKRKLTWGIAVLLGIIISVIFISRSNYKEYTQDNSKEIIATVNDYNIYQSDVDNIYNQLEGDVQKEKILQDIIDEYVVIEQAEKYGIEITDDEVQDLISQFQKEQNQVYQRGVEIYGKESFEDSLKEQMIYEKVKSIVLEKELNLNENEKIEAFKQFMLQSGDETIKDMSPDEIINNRREEMENYIFDKWVIQKRSEVKIQKKE